MILKCDSTLKGTITLNSAMSAIDDKELSHRYYSHEDGVGRTKRRTKARTLIINNDFDEKTALLRC